MRHEDILASVSVLVLAGVIVYAAKAGGFTLAQSAEKAAKRAANQYNAGAAIAGEGGSALALVNGPAIYTENTPYPYWPPIGNVIPSTSGTNTLPGTGPSDFLGFLST